MVHELRAYWANPGKLDALHRRFTEHTIPLFRRHGMTVVAFWTPADRATLGDLVYILGYPDAAARDQCFADFAADPEWVAAKAASEVDGVLVAQITSVMLTPTEYSPLQ